MRLLNRGREGESGEGGTGNLSINGGESGELIAESSHLQSVGKEATYQIIDTLSNGKHCCHASQQSDLQSVRRCMGSLLRENEGEMIDVTVKDIKSKGATEFDLIQQVRVTIVQWFTEHFQPT